MSVVTPTVARKGRIPELLLLLVALALGTGAWILVNAGVGNEGFPASLTTIAGGSLLLAFVAHLVIRAVAPYADPVFFPAALALNGLGLAMIHRLDIANEVNETRGQLMLSAVGIVLMAVTVLVLKDHRWLRRFTWSSLIMGIVLLLLPMIPGLGRTYNGARIWIYAAGFSYQPAELAKICLAVFFAGYLVVERDNLSLAGPKVLGIHVPKARHFVPILVAWLACMGVLAFERDFGTALLFFGLFVAMLYIATERFSWLIIGGLLSIVGIAAIVKAVPHIQARFEVWLHALDPEVYDAKFGSYQLVQGMFGMASGGLFGTGFGQGYPQKTYAANSDFIIASFGEEIGLAGLLALLSIYLIFVMRGMRTAVLVKDGFGKLLAAGLSFTIAWQAFLVVGGVTRLIPLTGLAMPFLAHGGSALLTNWIIVGLLIRMSDAARRPASSEPLPPPSLLSSFPEESHDHSSEMSPESSSDDSQLTEVVKLS
ncbi:FtsW/RodA/SpoVE family cell cycle protein [Arcanobacterium haemolyticum]|nr:FtsW/RodA/SpoVE family cell cycle protein [Arcanobacterium haemolyticum]